MAAKQRGHRKRAGQPCIACTQVAEKLPPGTKAFPFNYWGGLTPAQFGAMTEGGKDVQAGEREVSTLLAINLALLEMASATAEFHRHNHEEPRTPHSP